MTDIEPTPKLSVVIASLVGAPFIDDCLASIEAESRRLDAEVIVVAGGTDSYAARIRNRFPWVKVVHRGARQTVPELRRAGVLECTGDFVAIIEEHCVAAPNWLRTMLRAHQSARYGAVGGPIVDHDYRRLRDWVVYFLEYNGSLPPAPDGDAENLNGANVGYRRDVLLGHEALLAQGYWEATLHPVLRAEGVRLRSVPEMIVRHRGPFNFGYYLQQRYWFSRAFAGARARGMSLAGRATYLAAAPLIPAVLLARMTARVWRKRCRRPQFVLAVPLLIPALAVYVAGECMGCLAGPGDALSKVE